MPAPKLHLKKRVPHRILAGHPWVFASEVAGTDAEAEDGGVVACYSSRGEFLGSGIYNSQSQIVFRRFSREEEKLDRWALRKRLDRAIHYRRSIHRRSPDRPLERLVWSDADSLPGLIVDRYGDVLVVQTLTVGMDRRQALIAELLVELLSPSAIIARNDVPIRRLEGLEQKVEILTGSIPDEIALEVDGIMRAIDLRAGQKTGLYLDQLDNYLAVAKWAEGKRVLDCFCHQGGFALACAHAGAVSVQGIDQSEEAIAIARKTAEKNQLKIDWTAANVFDELPKLESDGGQFDLIILDPPSFTRSKGQLESAMRGYKELHLRAVRLLADGGKLATFCCSHHVGEVEWRELLVNVAGDTGVSLRELERLSQPPDHPVLIEVPETEYLRGNILEKI